MITIANLVVVGTALALAPAQPNRDARPIPGTAAPAILLDSVPSDQFVPASPMLRLAMPGAAIPRACRIVMSECLGTERRAGSPADASASLVTR